MYGGFGNTFFGIARYTFSVYFVNDYPVLAKCAFALRSSTRITMQTRSFPQNGFLHLLFTNLLVNWSDWSDWFYPPIPYTTMSTLVTQRITVLKRGKSDVSIFSGDSPLPS